MTIVIVMWLDNSETEITEISFDWIGRRIRITYIVTIHRMNASAENDNAVQTIRLLSHESMSLRMIS